MHPIIRQIVDRQHVGASDRAIVRAIVRATKGRTIRSFRQVVPNAVIRHGLYRDALQAHRENQRLYRDVMTGNLG